MIESLKKSHKEELEQEKKTGGGSNEARTRTRRRMDEAVGRGKKAARGMEMLSLSARL